MTIAFKMAIGAVIGIIGLIGLSFSLPMSSNAVASNVPVFTEADVATTPNSITYYIAAVAGSTVALAVGISIFALGLGDTYSLPREKNQN